MNNDTTPVRTKNKPLINNKIDWRSPKRLPYYGSDKIPSQKTNGGTK